MYECICVLMLFYVFVYVYMCVYECIHIGMCPIHECLYRIYVHVNAPLLHMPRAHEFEVVWSPRAHGSLGASPPGKVMHRSAIPANLIDPSALRCDIPEVTCRMGHLLYSDPAPRVNIATQAARAKHLNRRRLTSSTQNHVHSKCFAQRAINSTTQRRQSTPYRFLATMRSVLPSCRCLTNQATKAKATPQF